MYTRRNIRWSVLFRFSWRHILIFLLWSTFVTAIFLQVKQYNGLDCSIPIAPLTIIGIAVAFYVGFKNNQSYDRGWEARKIWGGIVNRRHEYVQRAGHRKQAVSGAGIPIPPP